MARAEHHFNYVLRLGDNALVLGQRLSEWCGHAPFLEEDIALANTALDHVGRARMLLTHAGELEGKGRDEDALAYHRDEREYCNLLMCELPCGDFGFTYARQFLLDSYHYLLFEALQSSTDATLAGIAAKAFKESSYHRRHSAEWMVRLGDGTEESHRRVQQALDELWRFTGELFEADAVDTAAVSAGIGPDPATLRDAWQRDVTTVLDAATLEQPQAPGYRSGGRSGVHTEHLGYLLAEMQHLQRAYPGATW